MHVQPDNSLTIPLRPEHWVYICHFLIPADIMNLYLSQKYFSEITKDNQIWRNKSQLYFKTIPENDAYEKFTESFKKRIVDQRLFFKQKENIRTSRIFSAIIENDLQTLKSLKLQLIELDICNNDKYSVITYAFNSNNKIILNYFFELVHNEYHKLMYPYFYADSQKRTLLHWAIYCQQPANIISELIENGCSLDAQELAEQRSPIHLACWSGQLETVKVIIEKDSNQLNKKDAFNQTPIRYAASFNAIPNINVMSYLVKEMNAELDHCFFTGFNALHWAIHTGCTQSAKILISPDSNNPSKGINLNQTSTRGIPIHYACELGHANIVAAILIKDKTQVHKGEDVDITPLIKAIMNKRIAVAKVLIDYGAHTIETSKRSPLHLACALGLPEVVQYILNKYPNQLNSMDFYNKKPIEYAAEYNQPEIVKYLTQQKALITRQTLEFAVRQDYLEIVKILLKQNPLLSPSMVFGNNKIVINLIKLYMIQSEASPAAIVLKNVMLDISDKTALYPFKEELNKHNELGYIYENLRDYIQALPRIASCWKLTVAKTWYEEANWIHLHSVKEFESLKLNYPEVKLKIDDGKLQLLIPETSPLTPLINDEIFEITSYDLLDKKDKTGKKGCIIEIPEDSKTIYFYLLNNVQNISRMRSFIHEEIKSYNNPAFFKSTRSFEPALTCQIENELTRSLNKGNILITFIIIRNSLNYAMETTNNIRGSFCNRLVMFDYRLGEYYPQIKSLSKIFCQSLQSQREIVIEYANKTQIFLFKLLSIAPDKKSEEIDTFIESLKNGAQGQFNHRFLTDLELALNVYSNEKEYLYDFTPVFTT